MFVIVIDEKKCTACGECVKICPVEIFKLVDNRIVIGNTDECTNCKSCVEVCESEAITITEV
ncbi:MAG: 4Fe-4S dicluster domain-containing protein [Verrucomicrobia bacterium]|nr:4Fe-4S dicluster domain-containing protein [Verrucomicrobiota bacterium]